MADKINGDEILKNVDIVDVVERHVRLKKNGAEYEGICPFHDEKTPSLKVNRSKQIFKCFGCNAGGDAIEFLRLLGHSFQEAVTEINGGPVTSPRDIVKRDVKVPERKTWTQIKPAPKSGVTVTHYKHGTPTMRWAYHDAEGGLLGYVCRFDTGAGKKEVLPLIYATDGTKSEWRWQGFDKPRPLYGLNRLAAAPTATVIVVEGEKTADAAQKLFPHAVAVAWLGGAQGIDHADWTAIHGRKVLLWADNDWSHEYGEKHRLKGQRKPFHEQPGNKAMMAIAEILKGHCPIIKWVKNPDGTPCGWDLADAEWTPAQAQAYARANLIEVPKPEPEIIEEQPKPAPPEPPPLPIIPDFPPDMPEDLIEEDEVPFKFLGYTKDGDTVRHHFMPTGSKTVVSLTPSAMTKANLIGMGDLNFWESTFPNSSGGIKTEAAANWLIQTSLRHGIFSEKRLRGRGAWIDGQNVVIHAGDRLVVNGKATDITKFESRFIYEFSEELGFNTQNPLDKKEASRLLEVLSLLNWERDINRYLLAGWCVVAPVCGALTWRPHIWITGAAGTGKSWLFKNVVRRLLGETALAVQGETSEPGLRQALGHDALPVVFDEAEGEDRKAQERMQAVLALMRAASADDGGIMAKGTSSGTAKTYRIRSCFAFASIGVQVAQQSDRSRVSILALKRATDPDKESRWARLQELYLEVITNEFVRRLQARTVKLLPIIIENSRVFAAAAASILGEQRTGDQLGALLAGAYSLTSESKVTLEFAKGWVGDKDWTEERGLERTRDEIALITYLLDQITSVDTYQGRYERTIAELIAIARHLEEDINVGALDAEQRLRRLGFRIHEHHHLIISNSAEWIKSKLKDTPWARNHNKILQRIDKAEALDSYRFGPGAPTRAVAIPFASILGNP